MRVADLVTASVLLLVGGVVVFDAVGIGIGWGTDGPKSGFFPFWLGVLLIAACGLILVQAARRVDAKPFVRREQLGPVLKVLWPAVAITPYDLFVAVIGITLGTIIGVLPGLGGANGVAILLPLTFTMPPTSAIILLTSLYWGALFGGAITSILFNIPGEPWSVATTF